MASALAGGFLTTAPPGKSHPSLLLIQDLGNPTPHSCLESFFCFVLFCFVLFFWPHFSACRILVPQGWNPCPLQWKHGFTREVPRIILLKMRLYINKHRNKSTWTPLWSAVCWAPVLWVLPTSSIEMAPSNHISAE